MQEIQKIEVKQRPSLPPLIQRSEFYKIVIPSEVETKIRLLCARISEVEWSGTLFYTVEGNIEDESLTIICKDIYVMDIGTSTYTEFDVNPGVAAYMCDHPELLDSYCGLIHSHNWMATFFSSTDTSTLREEGNKRNHFVSLIVNNAGTYTAAITRKIVSYKTITESYCYKTFNNEEVCSTREYTSEDTEILWNYLTIEKEEAFNPFLELEQQITELRSKPKRQTFEDFPKVSQNTRYYSISEDKEYKQKSLFDDIDDKEMLYVPSDRLVRSYLLQLITGAIAIADETRIVPEKWAHSMVSIFDKRFNKDVILFEEWASCICEFICTSCCPINVDLEEYSFAIASSLYEELDKLPSNKYIEVLKTTLKIWM